MKMKNEIIEYYKTAKGTMKTKCLEIAKMLNVNLEFCTREYLERSRQKNVNGCTDGNEILLINLKDKFDLFTFFHEVGHCLLHHSAGLSATDYLKNKQKYEDEANNFAEECLLLIYGNSVLNITRVCKI
jgi:hypothetical protein